MMQIITPTALETERLATSPWSVARPPVDPAIADTFAPPPMSRSRLVLSVFFVSSVLVGSPRASDAQKSGTLLPSASSRSARPSPEADTAAFSARRGEYGAVLSPDEQRRFAVLLTQPMVSSPLRSSVWSANLVTSSEDDEVKVQMNVCDAAIVKCEKIGQAAIFVALAGALNKDGPRSDLADLDGLFGKSRVEGGITLFATRTDWVPGISLKGSYGRPEFTFVSGTVLTPDTVRRDIFSAGAGLSRKRATYALYGGFQYQDVYEAGDPGQVCSPATVGPAGTLACQEIAIDAPGRTIKGIASVEFRKSLGSSAAGAVTISRDVHNWVTGVDVPVWFIPTDKGELGAGVRVGYKSDTRWSLGMFVAAFKM